MVLLSGMFLFRALCLVVNCDIRHKQPEILSEPANQVLQKRNLEIDYTVPVVKTEAGYVEGFHATSTDGKKYFAFEGIPYGESTGGHRRWKPPVPKKPWSGIRQTKTPGPDCLQFDALRFLSVHGSEDCLFLNVYTPTLPLSSQRKAELLPVVAYIHGGAFISGSGKDYGAAYMMNENVLLVTINYRLGALGFLSTGDEVIPGNMGLKDQALALKWINTNIEFFGGNKENVTLMGNSAGGVSVHLHLVSNKTRNYFSTAFSSSGTGMQHWGVQNKKYMDRLLYKFLKIVGCNDNSNSFVIENCLRKKDPNLLVAVQPQLYDWLPFPVILFSPVVESNHPDAFLTSWPAESYKNGDVAKKPFIMGYTKNEGQLWMAFMLTLMRVIPLRVMWHQIAPHYLEYYHTVSDPQAVTKQITSYFFKGTNPRIADEEIFSQMQSDRFIKFEVLRGLQAHIYSGAPSYFYRFSFQNGKQNSASLLGFNSTEWGAAHIDDISYFLNYSLIDARDHSMPDYEISKIMIKLLVNFASTGLPYYKSETGDTHIIWEPARNTSDIKGLKFDTKIEMINLPEEEITRMRFWNTLNIPNMTLWAPL